MDEYVDVAEGSRCCVSDTNHYNAEAFPAIEALHHKHQLLPTMASEKRENHHLFFVSLLRYLSLNYRTSLTIGNNNNDNDKNPCLVQSDSIREDCYYYKDQYITSSDNYHDRSVKIAETEIKNELYCTILSYLHERIQSSHDKEECYHDHQFNILQDILDYYSKKMHEDLSSGSNNREILIFEMVLSILVYEITSSTKTKKNDSKKMNNSNEERIIYLLEVFIEQCCSDIISIVSKSSLNLNNNILPLLIRNANHSIKLLRITTNKEKNQIYFKVVFTISQFIFSPTMSLFDLNQHQLISSLLHNSNNDTVPHHNIELDICRILKAQSMNNPLIMKSNLSQYIKALNNNGCKSKLLLLDISKLMIENDISNDNVDLDEDLVKKCAYDLLYTLYEDLNSVSNDNTNTLHQNINDKEVIHIILQHIGIDNNDILQTIRSAFFSCDKNDDGDSRKAIFKEKYFFQFRCIISTIYFMLPLIFSCKSNSSTMKKSSSSNEDINNTISTLLPIFYTLLDDYDTNNQIIGCVFLHQLFHHINQQKHGVLNQNQINLCRHVLTTAYQRCMSNMTSSSLTQENDNDISNIHRYYLIICFHKCINEFINVMKESGSNNDTIVWIQDLLRYNFQQLYRQYYNNSYNYTIIKIILYHGIHPLFHHLQEKEIIEKQHGIDILSVALSSILYISNDIIITKNDDHDDNKYLILYGIGLLLLDLLFTSYPIITFHTGKIICSLLLHCHRFKKKVNIALLDGVDPNNSEIKYQNLYNFLVYVTSITYVTCGDKAGCVFDDMIGKIKEKDNIRDFICSNVKENGSDDFLIQICLDVKKLANDIEI